MTPTPLPASALLTAWTPWPPGVLILAVTAAPYLLWWRRATRLGRPWPRWRALVFLVAGVGLMAYCLVGPLQVERSRAVWVGALQVGLLACVVPVALGLGDPVRLWTLGRPVTGAALSRGGAMRRLARVAMFPFLSSAVAIGSLMAVFFTGYYAASTRSSLIEAFLVVHMLVTGLLVALPLLVDGLLPSWATPGLRAAMAFADGLFDAIPGIALMTSSTLVAPSLSAYVGLSPAAALTSQQLAGGVLLAVAELVGIPFIGAVVVEWVRDEGRQTRIVDAALDRSATESAVQSATGTPTSSSGLWWENDPRFADRPFGRRSSG